MGMIRRQIKQCEFKHFNKEILVDTHNKTSPSTSSFLTFGLNDGIGASSLTARSLTLNDLAKNGYSS